MDNMGQLIALLRKERRFSQEMLANRVQCTKQTISNYERGLRRPDYETLEAIADVLNVPITFFLSRDEQRDALNRIYQTYPQPKAYPNITPLGPTYKVPLLGKVAAGVPVTTTPEDGETISLPFDPGKANAALRVQGDSMTPHYIDGDIVLIRYQDDVNDGQIAAVCIDDTVTLKHVYHIPDGVTLISDNPAYPPMTYTLDDANTIHLIGLAVGYLRWE